MPCSIACGDIGSSANRCSSRPSAIARGARGRPQTAALHRDGIAAGIPLHRRLSGLAPQLGERKQSEKTPHRWSAAPMPSSGFARHGRSPPQAGARSSDHRRGRGGKDHADRALHGRSRRGSLRSRAVRRAVRRGGALSPRSRSTHGIVPPGCSARRARFAQWLRPGCSSCRGSPARPNARTLRRELAGAGQAPMLREMGELLDRYTENRPLLLVTEDLHWSDSGDGAAHRLHRAPSLGTRLLWVASFRLTEVIAADHPLEGGAPRASPARAGGGDRARCVLGERSRRVRRRSHFQPSAATKSFVRALHGRTDGLPLFVADVVNDVDGRTARDRFNGDAEEPDRDHRTLHPAAHSGGEGAAGCGERMRGRISAHQGCACAGTRRRIPGRIVRGASAPATLAERGRRGIRLSARALPGGALPAHRPARSRGAAPKVAASLERERADGRASERGRARVPFRARP